MKKLSVVIAVIVAVLLVVTACASTTTPSASASTAAAPSSAAPSSAAPSVAASSAAPSVAASVAPSASASASTLSALDQQKQSDAAVAKMQADALAGVASGANKDVVIGYNAGTESLEFFQDVYGGMKDQAKKYGVKLLYTDSEFDATKIMSNVDTLLMQKANVIIDFNVNAQVGGSIVDEVKSKGGKGTIGVDVKYNSANGTDQSWFMGANNEVAGELCGQAIGDYVTKNKAGKLDKLVLFWNSENGDLVKKRMGGAITGLAAKGINLTDSQIEWIDMGGGGSDTTVAAKDKFTDWLTANPNLHSIGVVAVNDESMQGVLAAAQTAGRTDDVILAAHNVGANFTQEVTNNGPACWIGDVAYYPEHYGEYLIPLAIAIAHGTAPDPTNAITMNHVFVTRDQVPAYLKTYNDYKAQWAK
jgi:ribose transport system substrate-binding protein